jgi:hypothetical protein
MLRCGGKFGFALVLAAACALLAAVCIAQTPPQAPPTKASVSVKPKPRGKKSVPVAEVPPTPPPPPTLEEQPPAAPQVTYRDGQLTIDSRNATLSQVLHSVQAQTGASVDLPPGAGTERVVATIGPGKPRDVLASLLNGSKFNYVILGETNDPTAVQRVILMARTSAPADSPAMTTAQNNGRAFPPAQAQVVEPPPDDEYQAPEAEPDQPVAAQPNAAEGEMGNPQVLNPAGRTPEQMLQELQRIQQQQQQMQQQLNPSNQRSQPFPGQPVTSQPQ